MSDLPAQMNITNYARYIGVAHQSIVAAINRGEIIPLDNGLLDVAQANASYGRRRAQRAALRAITGEAVEKREGALLQRTIAQMALMQKRAEEMRATLAPRDASQAEVNGMTTALRAGVTFAKAKAKGWQAAAKRAALADLGDLPAEALRVTRR